MLGSVSESESVLVSVKEPLVLCMLSLPPANEVCEGNVFTRVCHSVHGEGVVSQHAMQVSRPTSGGGGGLGFWREEGLQAHTRGGGELRGLAGGVSRPTPGGW